MLDLSVNYYIMTGDINWQGQVSIPGVQRDGQHSLFSSW